MPLSTLELEYEASDAYKIDLDMSKRGPFIVKDPNPNMETTFIAKDSNTYANGIENYYVMYWSHKYYCKEMVNGYKDHEAHHLGLRRGSINGLTDLLYKKYGLEWRTGCFLIDYCETDTEKELKRYLSKNWNEYDKYVQAWAAKYFKAKKPWSRLKYLISRSYRYINKQEQSND